MFLYDSRPLLNYRPGESSMLVVVVSDIEDVFFPKPSHLLVNITEAGKSFGPLLGKIEDIFQENSIIGSAMHPALQAGFKLMVCDIDLLERTR